MVISLGPNLSDSAIPPNRDSDGEQIAASGEVVLNPASLNFEAEKKKYLGAWRVLTPFYLSGHDAWRDVTFLIYLSVVGKFQIGQSSSA